MLSILLSFVIASEYNAGFSDEDAMAQAILRSQQDQEYADREIALTLQQQLEKQQEDERANEIAALELAKYENSTAQQEILPYAERYYHNGGLSKFSNVTPEMETSFKELTKIIYGIKQNTDVHQLDKAVNENANKIIALAANFDPQLQDTSLLTASLADIKNRIIDLIKPFKDLLIQHQYEGSAISYDQIISHINNQFARLNGTPDYGVRIWARFITLAEFRLLYSETSDEWKNKIVSTIVDQSIEGLLTQGGCIPGFVNRGFIGLLTMLGYDLWKI